jgi:type IX secretion system PorP/SprF family membrane protein
MRRLLVIGFVVAVLWGGMSAQNTKNYTPVNMYMLNPLLINPAYSGTKESLSANMMIGANWLDIPGAQLGKADAAGWMQSGSFDLPLSEQMAVGFIIRNNSFGVNNNFVFYGHYSYRIITGFGKLSFGLRAGLNHYNRNLLKASFRDPLDPVQQFDYSRMYPNFGAGVYWYNDNYNVGFSVPDFFFPPTGSGLFDGDPRNYNYTLTGGYLFRVSDNFKIKPSTMLTYSLKSPLAYQVNLSFIGFKDMVWLGLGYKSQGFVILAEFQAATYLRIGYAYEIPTGGVREYAPWGSHEILIRFDNSWEVRNVSPVYFW